MHDVVHLTMRVKDLLYVLCVHSHCQLLGLLIVVQCALFNCYYRSWYKRALPAFCIAQQYKAGCRLELYSARLRSPKCATAVTAVCPTAALLEGMADLRGASKSS
jgi:hypothetical protein